MAQFTHDTAPTQYPDANHAAHYQYSELFTRHTRIFLDD